MLHPPAFAALAVIRSENAPVAFDALIDAGLHEPCSRNLSLPFTAALRLARTHRAANIRKCLFARPWSPTEAHQLLLLERRPSVVRTLVTNCRLDRDSLQTIAALPSLAPALAREVLLRQHVPGDLVDAFSALAGCAPRSWDVVGDPPVCATIKEALVAFREEWGAAVATSEASLRGEFLDGFCCYVNFEMIGGLGLAACDALGNDRAAWDVFIRLMGEFMGTPAELLALATRL